MGRSTGSVIAGYQRPLLVLCFVLVSPGFAYASYNFSLVGTTATVTPVAATGGPILIDTVLVAGNPFLEWSVDNGVTFSLDWDDATAGVQMLPAATSSSINLTPATGAGSSITLGDPASPASNIFAHVDLGFAGSPANNSLIIDDSTSTHAAGTYDFFSVLGSISGPGGATGGIDFSSPFGPINTYTVKGGPAGNTFNIHSTFNFTITNTTIIGGTADTVNVTGDVPPGIGTPLTLSLGGGANTVNIGDAGVLTTINSAVTVTDLGGSASVTVDDSADATGRAVTISGTQITGASTGAISFGAGVTAVTFNGGTGADTFTVTPSANTAMSINGDDPAPPTSPGDTLAMNLSGLTNPMLVKSSTASGFQGTWTFSNAANVDFTTMESLQPAGSPVPVTLNGGVVGGSTTITGATTPEIGPNSCISVFECGVGICGETGTLIGTASVDSKGQFVVNVSPPLHANELIFAVDSCSAVTSQIYRVPLSPAAPALSPAGLAMLVVLLSLVAWIGTRRAQGGIR